MEKDGKGLFSLKMMNFTAKVTSEMLQDQIENTEDISAYFARNSKYFLHKKPHEYLMAFLVDKNLTIADVVKDSLLTKSYVYEIFSGKKKPSRDKLIAIAFGLGLNDEEAQNMLKWTRHKELYVRDKRDAIIFFSIQHKFDIMKTNDILDEYGFPALGSFD